MKMVVVIDAVQLGTGLSMSAIVCSRSWPCEVFINCILCKPRDMRAMSQFLTLRSRSLMRVGDCH